MLHIEKVSYSKRNGGSYVLALSDGNSLQGIEARSLKEMGLLAGRELGPAELEKLRQVDALFSARAVAARFMDYRPRSRKEVSDKLERAGAEETVRLQVLAELEKKGSIDDAKFAREWVGGKALGGKSGAKLITKQLAERGVCRGVITAALAAGLPRQDSLEAARRLAEKKGRERDLAEPRERKRVEDYLLRRGFEREIVEEALKQE